MTPYRALGLSADVLDELERILRLGLATHPDAQHLLLQMTDDPVVSHSGSVSTGAEEDARKGRTA